MKILKKITKTLAQDFVLYIKQRNKKPIAQQIQEIYALQKSWNYLPYHYLRHCLYLANPQVEIHDYVPPAIINRFIHRINTESARYLTWDKVAFEDCMCSHGLPTTHTVAVLDKVGWKLRWHQEGTKIYDVLQHLKSFNTDRFIVKPNYSEHGSNIEELVLDGDSLRMGNRRFI